MQQFLDRHPELESESNLLFEDAYCAQMKPQQGPRNLKDIVTASFKETVAINVESDSAFHQWKSSPEIFLSIAHWAFHERLYVIAVRYTEGFY